MLTAATTRSGGKDAGFLSPDQLLSAGYRDGLTGKAPNRTYRWNPDYNKGYLAGYRTCPSSLFNVAAVPQAHLERGWGDELLNAL